MPPRQVQVDLFSRKDLLFFLGFLILFLLTFKDFFLSDRVIFERDTSVIEIPVRKLCMQLLKEGNFALWTDAYGNGQPFLANPKNAVFYPTTWLYLFLPFFTSFKLHYLIHVILGWIGLYYLCKSYSLSLKASFLGASLFFFSGMYLSSFEFYNHIAALAWMPWILLLLNRSSRSRASRIVLLSFFWALLVLAGAPEIILMTLFFAVAQALLIAGEWKRRILLTASSLLLAILISAIQLFPSFEMLRQTERSAQSSAWPLDLVQLVNMPFPHALGNDREPGHNDFWSWHLFDKYSPLYYSLYTGAGALLLFFFGLKKPWDRKQKYLLILFSVLFLLACGRYSPFFFLYRFTPLLSSIRYPVKFFLGSIFALSILAAMGFDAIYGLKVQKKNTLSILTVSAVLSLSLFYFFRSRILNFLDKLFIIDNPASVHDLGLSIGTALIFLVIYAALFLLSINLKDRARFLGWIIIALAVLDPAYHNRYVNPTVPESYFARPSLLSDLKPPLVIYRGQDYVLDIKAKFKNNARFLNYYHQSLFPFTSLGEGVRYVFNVDFYGTYPARFLRMMDSVKRLPSEGQLKILRYLGCGYYIADQPMFSNEESRRLEIEGRPLSLKRITNRAASPCVIFRSTQTVSLQEKLKMFTSETFDPLKEAIVEKDLHLTETVDKGYQPNINIKKEAQGRGWYSVNLPRQGLVIFPGNFAPGWQARIDGKKTEIFEVNLFSKGVLVETGEHEILLRYLPRSFIWGIAVSLVSIISILIIFGIIVILARKRGRRASL